MHGLVVEVETALQLPQWLMTAIRGSGTLESHVSPCTYREYSVALAGAIPSPIPCDRTTWQVYYTDAVYILGVVSITIHGCDYPRV
jgi:hypothetical protein